MMKRKFLTLFSLAMFGVLLSVGRAHAAPIENSELVISEQKAKPAPTPTPKPRKPGPRDEGDGE